MKNPFDFLFGKKTSEPQHVPGIARVPDMTYENVLGQHFYVFDWQGMKTQFADIDMSTVLGKTKALQIVTPFAAMVDRMSKLFALGADYVTDDENNDNAGTEIYDSVRKLIERPNPLQTSNMFKKQVETYLLVFGFCPVFGFRMSKNDIPTTLWCIPPDLFTAKMSGNFLQQTEYSDIIKEAYVQMGFKKIELQPEDYFVVFNGQIKMGVEGDMRVATPVDTLSATMNNWANQAIARGGVIVDGGPKGVLSNDDNSEFGNAAMTQKEQQRLNEAFKKKYGWVGKEFKVLVTQAALKWQAMSWNAKELMLDETRKTTMEDICFTLGWSYGLFDPSAQYSNNVAGEEKRTYTTVVMPDAKTYSQALTEFLNQPNLKYYLDYTDVEALQKDRKQEAETLNSMVRALGVAVRDNLISDLEARTVLSEYIDIDPEDIPEKPIPVPTIQPVVNPAQAISETIETAVE